MIKVDYSQALLNEDVNSYQDSVSKVAKELMEHTGKGSDYTGWVDWPENYDHEEFQRVIKTAKRIREDCDILLVCGIGGSYLGARSALEFMRGLYPESGPEIIFAGNTFSPTYLKQLLHHLEGKQVYLNVISKSGTTTETSVSFRIFQQYIEEKYPEDANKHIIATTDKARGTLKELATKKGYETFVIPDNIGGRYSVFTSVGLLPLAVAGIDIEQLMKGSYDAYKELQAEKIEDNPAYQYAVCRRILEKQGKVAEMLVTYEPNQTMIAEWWKQLFGESEGKEGKGILPVSATFTTDLHSLGQFIQEGTKLLFETVLKVDKPLVDYTFPEDKENLDHMNYLAGKSLDWVNKMAMEGTIDAHVNTGKVPNILIEIPDATAYSYGYLIYFFFKACAISCYLLDINPFNQPGVEVYKKKMFKLLGKE